MMFFFSSFSSNLNKIFGVGGWGERFFIPYNRPKGLRKIKGPWLHHLKSTKKVGEVKGETEKVTA